MVFDRNKIERHGPSQGVVIDELPRKIIKIENEINTRYPQNNLRLTSDSYVLRNCFFKQAPFELYKDCYYVGQWREGQKNGLGKLFFPDGSAYSGYFKNGVARG